MLLISDVHAAFDAMRRVGQSGEPLLVLGDFLNFIDYRTGEGMVADIAGLDFARTIAEARRTGASARELWNQFRQDQPNFRADIWQAAETQYAQASIALEGFTSYVTFGNVDERGMLEAALPSSSRFTHGEVLDIEGWRVGIVGGGGHSPVSGEDGEVLLEAGLEKLGPVDVLCTHLAPSVPALHFDVVTGRLDRNSPAVLAYVKEHQPKYHFFGDIHQPKATSWEIGNTLSRNVGYFRATGRPVRLPPR